MGDGKREIVAWAITHAPRGVKGGPYEADEAAEAGESTARLSDGMRYGDRQCAIDDAAWIRRYTPAKGARVIRIVRKARPPEASAVEVLRDMLATWDDLGFVRTEAFARARAVLAASGPDPMPVVRAAMAWRHDERPSAEDDLADAVETYQKAGGK